MSKATKNTASVEVVNASEVSTEAVVAAKKHGIEKGVKASLAAKIANAVETGALVFVATEDANVMVATTAKSRFTMTLSEVESERAKHSGKIVTCFIIGETLAEDGTITSKTPKINGRDVWTKFNPDYKFPSKSGVDRREKTPRELKAKKPAVVHSIDDMI